MTRSVGELSRYEHIDLKVLVEYIKNDLFPKSKFVLGKDEEWDVGGTIYNDYIKCCDDRGWKREVLHGEVWMRAVSKKLQKKALVQKGSERKRYIGNAEHIYR
jgi:hypothetical protein